MLDVKKSNSWTVEQVYENKLDIKRFIHNEVSFEVAFDYHQNAWKCPKTFKYDLKIDFTMFNLLMSTSFLWASSIVQLFDFFDNWCIIHNL